MKKLIFAIFFVIAFSGLALAAVDQIVVYDTGATANSSAELAAWIAQSFTIENDLNLSAFEVRIFRNGNPGIGTISVLSVNSTGQPNGTIWLSQSFNANTLSVDAKWIKFNMSTIFPRGKYAISLNGSVGGASNDIVWEYDETGTYAGGGYFRAAPFPNYVETVGRDFMFRVYGEDEVTLNSPTDGITVETLPITFNATTTIGNQTLVNATIFIYNSIDLIVNQTTNTLGATTTEETTWEVGDLLIGEYNWNVYSCGTSRCVWGDTNQSFIYGFVVNSETFEAEVNDLSNSTFRINVTFSDDILTDTASLIYDGISYSATKKEIGPDTIFTKILDVPAVSAAVNKTFYWTFFTTNGGSQAFNATENNQSVRPTIIAECDGATYIVPAINFTIRDESTLTYLTADFDATFYWSLGGTQTKNASFQLDGDNTYQFCILPNGTYYTDIDLALSKTGYETRMFGLYNLKLNNTLQYMTLYLLNNTAASRIIIEVKDEGFSPLDGYIVKIWKFVPETGEFILVEEQITDTFGQFAAKLIENDVRYKFEFFDEDGVLRRTAERTNIVCRSTICVLSFVVQDTTDDFVNFGDIENQDYTLIYDNSTTSFIFTWNDNTGEVPTHWLMVSQYNLNGTWVYCNLSSTALIGTLNCTLSSIRASYTAQVYREVNNVFTRLDVLTVKIGDYASTFGKEGLFWAMLLLFTLSIALIFSPVVSMLMFVIGFLLLSVAGIVYSTPAIMIAIAVIGGLAIWAFRS